MKKFLFVLMLGFSMIAFGQKLENKVVEVGCGMCQYDLKTDKGCHMAINYNGKIYHVEGMDKKVFGDAHASDGYCMMKKQARVSGQLKGSKFHATRFAYVEKPVK